MSGTHSSSSSGYGGNSFGSHSYWTCSDDSTLCRSTGSTSLSTFASFSTGCSSSSCRRTHWHTGYSFNGPSTGRPGRRATSSTTSRSRSSTTWTCYTRCSLSSQSCSGTGSTRSGRTRRRGLSVWGWRGSRRRRRSRGGHTRSGSTGSATVSETNCYSRCTTHSYTASYTSSSRSRRTSRAEALCTQYSSRQSTGSDRRRLGCRTTTSYSTFSGWGYTSCRTTSTTCYRRSGCRSRHGT